MQKIKSFFTLMAVVVGTFGVTSFAQAATYCGGWTDTFPSTDSCTAAIYTRDRGIMGVNLTSFSPYNNLNRVEAVATVLRSFVNENIANYGAVNGSQLGFRDTPSYASEWWYPYVYRAKQLAFVSGYSDGYFRPDNGVTRAEFAKMFLAASSQASSVWSFQPASYDYWADTNYSAWYYRYMAFVSHYGLFGGIGNCPAGYQCPNQQITRAEVAQFIFNYKQHFGDVGGFGFVNNNNSYAPTLLTPSNGQNFAATTQTMDYSWTAVPNATSYRLQVRNSGTNNYVLDQTVYTNSYSWYQYTSATASYSWKVIAYTSNGATYTSNENYYSLGGSGGVGIGGTPVLYSPNNGQTFAGNSQNVNFTWSAVSGASYYRIQIRNSNSSTYFFDQTTTSNSYTSYQNYNTPVTYYWRVWAYDGYGNSNVSGENSYTFGSGSTTNTLVAPTLYAPTNGQTFSNASNQTVNFTWSAAQGAAYYRIKVRTSASSNYFIDQTVYTNSYSYYFNVLNSNVSYYWTVYAYDNNGNSMWPSENMFSFQGTPTPTPTNNLGSFQLSSPQANTTLSAVNQTVNFSWTPSANATYYVVKIRLSTSSNYFVNTTVTTNSYSYPFVVAGNNLSYFWTVEAHDANGNVAYPPNGAEYGLNFSVQQTTLTPPQIISPNNTTYAYRMSDGPAITFTWTATPGATYYKFYCSAAEGMACSVNGTNLGNVTTYTAALGTFPPKAPIIVGSKGTWSWYVRAYDANGNYADSQYGIFTVQQ